MGELFKDKEHLVRVAGLLAVGLIGFLVLRGVLIPADFGELGHYRASALDDNRSVPLHFAGRAVCEECHDDVAEERAGGAHQRVGCEACHGALELHAVDPDALVPELPVVTPLCVSCHRASAAKPDWFPTVEPDVHSEGEACDECHMPHAPGI
ncbi:MAG: cytochrome c family protein [Thermoanaerobaculales bacterium]|nr:cytochrome c family protein [Thermoanaerobaculales bacterium]